MAHAQSRYRLVDGHKTIEINQADFETAKDDRDELFGQLEMESWFAEVRRAHIAWLEGLLRFAARTDSEDAWESAQIQRDCEITGRITSVLVASHGLRKRINDNHDGCPNKHACIIAEALRDCWTHTSTRILSTRATRDNLLLKGSQIDRMPSNGSRHAFEISVMDEELVKHFRSKARRHKVRQAAMTLFPNGRIDIAVVNNHHMTCINRSMAAYRAKVKHPGASRDRLLARYGFSNKPMIYIQHETEERIWLGDPFDRMLAERDRIRKEHREVPVFELVQFGRGEVRAGSLEEARDYTFSLLDDRGLNSWTTGEAAAALDLDSGYPGEALCKDAPPLFRDAIARLYQRAHEAENALLWSAHTLRVLPRRLREYNPKA